jgi:hypothetical protein
MCTTFLKFTTQNFAHDLHDVCYGFVSYPEQKATAVNILSHVRVTIDEVWIGDSIY